MTEKQIEAQAIVYKRWASFTPNSPHMSTCAVRAHKFFVR